MTADKQIFVSSRHLEDAQTALRGLETFISDLNDEYLDFEAWSVFHVWLDGRPQKDAPYFSAFRAWQIFHWQPVINTVPLPIDDNCKTIAEAYLKLRGSTLSSAEIKVIRNGVKYSPDIYEVCSFNGDQVIAVGSISKQKISIFQPGLSKQGKSGDFLMAHAIPATLDHHILLGSSNFITRKAKPLVQKFCSLAERCDNSRPGAFETLQSDFFNLFYDLVNFAAPTK